MKRDSKFTFVIIGIVIFVAVAVATATLGKKSDTMSGGNVTMSNEVTIKDYAFTPASIKVKVGTTVTWTNQDVISHTVTADTNSTDAPSSMDIAKGKSYSFTFAKAGTFTYHCFPHPYMHGTVEVTN